jgi:hypothetical protein
MLFPMDFMDLLSHAIAKKLAPRSSGLVSELTRRRTGVLDGDP